MRVNPNSEAPEVSGLKCRKAVKETAELGEDETSFSTISSLSAALEGTPAVRLEKVMQAKRLLEDPNYPPQVVIHKLSTLLAMNLQAVDSAAPNSDESSA